MDEDLQDVEWCGRECAPGVVYRVSRPVDPSDPRCAAAFEDLGDMPEDDWADSKQDVCTQFDIPASALKTIIGPNRSKHRQLEEVTGATFEVVSTDTRTFVQLRGPSEDAVNSLQVEIEELVAAARKKLGYTHFVCLRVGSAASAEGRAFSLAYQNFADGVRRELGEEIAALLTRESKLHFTVVCLSLMTDRHVAAVCGLLEDLCASVRDRRRGGVTSVMTASFGAGRDCLEVMTEDVDEAHVVFLKDNALQAELNSTFFQKLFDRLVARGLADTDSLDQQRALNPRKQADVRLHCTVLNTIKAARRKEGGGARTAVDARRVQKLFASHDFQSVAVGEVRLCVMGTAVGEDGFYETVGKWSIS